jgi:hypothetical protein
MTESGWAGKPAEEWLNTSILIMSCSREAALPLTGRLQDVCRGSVGVCRHRVSPLPMVK